ncbi:MAG TPA: hypothetical protein VIW67_18510 [Terriglobales bacterium]
MTILMEQQTEQQHRPCCTRQQAAALLEGLRAQYQALSRCEQGAVTGYLLTESDMQFSLEGEE